MIKSQVLVGPSCLTAAEDDEPLFVLRANDELAPEAVLHWARQYVRRTSIADPDYNRKINKYHEATTLAMEMIRWRERKEKLKVIALKIGRELDTELGIVCRPAGLTDADVRQMFGAK